MIVVLVSVEPEAKTSQDLENPVPCEEPIAEEIETITMETNGSIDMSVGSEEVEEGEGEGEKVTTAHQPMDLGSPLEEDEDVVESDTKGEEEKLDDLGCGERRAERLDSNFDSSYQPGSEELLYEGDPEHETETKPETEHGEEGAPSTLTSQDEATVAERREEEEGFMVEVHYKDQGGGLEDPAATTAPLQEMEKKQASSDGGKTAGDSARFVLPCRFPSHFPPFLSSRVVLFQLEHTHLSLSVISNWCPLAWSCSIWSTLSEWKFVATTTSSIYSSPW